MYSPMYSHHMYSFCIRLCRSTRFLRRSPSRQTFSWILGAYVSAGWGKVAVIFSITRPKSGGYGTPHSKKWRVRVPPVPLISYACDIYERVKPKIGRRLNRLWLVYICHGRRTINSSTIFRTILGDRFWRSEFLSIKTAVTVFPYRLCTEATPAPYDFHRKLAETARWLH